MDAVTRLEPDSNATHLFVALNLDNTIKHWPVIGDMLAPLLAEEDLFNHTDILAGILKGEALAWVAWNKAEKFIEGVVITRIGVFPKARTFQAPYCVGKNLEQWLVLGLGELEAYARSNGCKMVQGWNRKGWLRKYPGLVETGSTFTKILLPVGDK